MRMSWNLLVCAISMRPAPIPKKGKGCHNPQTHLIPLVLYAASGRRDAITVFGTDYDAEDGTCNRDYVYVQDMPDAHLLTLLRIMKYERSVVTTWVMAAGSR